MIDYKDICEKVCRTARLAGAFIAEQRLTFTSDKVELKGRQNLVSFVDKESEIMIVEELDKILPGASIIGEEGSERQGSDYCWIIDPLDGTTNFVHNMPPYCVSIALTKGTEVVVGVVFEITIGECFYAWQGSEAYMNGKQIHVSAESELENSLLISGLAYNVDQIRDRFNYLFDYFNRNSHGMRRTGSAAANIAYIAAGRAECFFQEKLSPWDVAAAALIVERAGGKVTDYTGGDNYIFGPQIIVTNGTMHQTFLDIIR